MSKRLTNRNAERIADNKEDEKNETMTVNK
jgi:hypothetical protein